MIGGPKPGDEALEATRLEATFDDAAITVIAHELWHILDGKYGHYHREGYIHASKGKLGGELSEEACNEVCDELDIDGCCD